MSDTVIFVLASFTVPENIGTDPLSVLWLMPLAAAIAVAYKATKMAKIKAGSFLKEVAVLFGSIVVFIFLTALALYVLELLLIE